MGRYGTNLEGFGAFEGGVNSQSGAPLIATQSIGAESTLLGPALVREVTTLVANGDFLIPPLDPDSNISESNPLPYWTFTDVNSSGAITCKVVTDSTAANASVLQWSVAASTTTGKSATLHRYVPVLTNGQTSTNANFYLFSAAIGLPSGGTTESNAKINIQFEYYDAGLTLLSASAAVSADTAFNAGTTNLSTQSLLVPATAAYAKVTITCKTTGTTAAAVRSYQVKAVQGFFLPGTTWIPDSSVSTPSSNSTYFTNNAGVIRAWGNLMLTQGILYMDVLTTGTRLELGGTNTRLLSVQDGDFSSSTSSTKAGILITKSVTGQPTTNINGTGTTDAFSDSLRNGGLASDNTNGRFYVYNGGAWKYAALTTPSDSLLKEQITPISDALEQLRALVPVAFRWKRPDAHPRTDAVDDDGQRLGFLADQVATTPLKRWVEAMKVGDMERDLVDEEGDVLALNIPQNEMEALVVAALLEIDARLKALEEGV